MNEKIIIYNKMLFKFLGDKLVEIVKDENLKESADLLVERLKSDLDKELLNFNLNKNEINEIENDIKKQMSKNNFVNGLNILFVIIDMYLEKEIDIAFKLFNGNENVREELIFIKKIKPLEKYVKTTTIKEMLKLLTNFEQQDNLKGLEIIKKINFLKEAIKEINIEKNIFFERAFNEFYAIEDEIEQINKKGITQIEKNENKEEQKESEELKLLNKKVENLKAIKDELSVKNFSISKLNELEKKLKIDEKDFFNDYDNLLEKIRVQLFTMKDDSKDKEKLSNENKKLSTEKREVEKMLIEMKILISEKKDELSKIL